LKLSNTCSAEVFIVNRGGVLCILLIVKLGPQADTTSNRMWVWG